MTGFSATRPIHKTIITGRYLVFQADACHAGFVGVNVLDLQSGGVDVAGSVDGEVAVLGRSGKLGVTGSVHLNRKVFHIDAGEFDIAATQSAPASLRSNGARRPPNSS